MKYILLVTIIICYSCMSSKSQSKQHDFVTIKGYTENLKTGAALISVDNLLYYIDGLPSWEIGRGISVIVTGKLDVRLIEPLGNNYNPEEEATQTIGDGTEKLEVLYLKEIEWKIDTIM